MAGKYGSHMLETMKCAAGCGADVKVTVIKHGTKRIIQKRELPYTTCLACRTKAAEGK